MTVNPIELIGGLTTNANVPKAEIVSWGKTRVAQVLVDADEVNSTNLAGQNAIQVKTLKQAYYLDAADTTTPDDGVSCIVSADGYRFKPAKLLPTGGLVGTSDTQTLTNKTIDGGSNTLTNIAIASFAAIGAATLLGNPTAASAHPEEFSIQSLAELLVPNFTSDYILAFDHTTGELRKVAPKNLAPQYFVNTIAQLRAIDTASHAIVQVNGYYTLGDCRSRIYWYDASDTSSTDNGGSVIVTSGGSRMKLIGPWTVKSFGVKDDGTDQSSALASPINAAATANVPLEWDANFSVSTLVVSGKSGLHWIGRGGVIGIASSAQDAVLQFINCTDVTINERFVINGAYNTNYTYGFHGYTNGASQDFQLFDLTNVIIVGCKTAWGFGNASRPDDDVAAVNIRGGYTSGCPQYLKAIGTQTVVHVAGANAVSSYGLGNATWQTLPAVHTESQGATVTITGGEVMCTQITHDCAFKLSAIAGATAGNQYGSITVSGAVLEVASALCFTDNKSLSSPVFGAFTMVGCRFVLTQDTFGGAVQSDGSYAGKIVIVGNTGFAPNVRGQWNVNAGNAACAVTVDVQSFGVNCLQGYAGLSGGTQYVIGDVASATERVITGTSATQGANDSYIVFATSGTCTFTMLDPARCPGRKVTFRNAAAQAINSASSNINSIGGTTGTSILPATAGKFVTLRASGSLWQVEAAN